MGGGEERPNERVVRDRRVLGGHVAPGGAVVAHGAGRDDQVPEREVWREAAAVADAEERLAPELHELLDQDRRARRADPRGGRGELDTLVAARRDPVLPDAADLADVLPTAGDPLDPGRIAAKEAPARRPARGGDP